MRCDKRGQISKGFALEPVAHLKPVLAGFPILTIKYRLPISLRLKRKISWDQESFLNLDGMTFSY